MLGGAAGKWLQRCALKSVTSNELPPLAAAAAAGKIALAWRTRLPSVAAAASICRPAKSFACSLHSLAPAHRPQPALARRLRGRIRCARQVSPRPQLPLPAAKLALAAASFPRMHSFLGRARTHAFPKVEAAREVHVNRFVELSKNRWATSTSELTVFKSGSAFREKERNLNFAFGEHILTGEH